MHWIFSSIKSKTEKSLARIHDVCERCKHSQFRLWQVCFVPSNYSAFCILHLTEKKMDNGWQKMTISSNNTLQWEHIPSLSVQTFISYYNISPFREITLVTNKEEYSSVSKALGLSHFRCYYSSVYSIEQIYLLFKWLPLCRIKARFTLLYQFFVLNHFLTISAKLVPSQTAVPTCGSCDSSWPKSCSTTITFNNVYLYKVEVKCF